MNDTIKCPHCGKSFPMTQAISHELEEKYTKFYKIRLDEEKSKFAKTMQPEIEKKIKESMEFEMKNKNNELEETKKQNKNLQEQLLDLNKLLRQIKSEGEEKRIEMEKKLTAAEDKIREEEKKKADEEYKLKILEKDRKLEDALKMVDEYKRKFEQGSQQIQGDVMERELKNTIASEFPYDEVSDVPTGIRGADIVQRVKNNQGRDCGIILWESKRTKNWTEGWIAKLKEDQRTIKAEAAIIVSQVMPEGVKNFGLRDGIWVSNYQSIVGAAYALRNHLIEMSSIKAANRGKEDKKEILWNYLNGTEFQQRMEAIADVYNQMQDELEIEKRWFAKKWAKQEKNIRQVIDSISGMDGDLKSITGKSLPDPTKSFSLKSGEKEE